MESNQSFATNDVVKLKKSCITFQVMYRPDTKFRITEIVNPSKNNVYTTIKGVTEKNKTVITTSDNIYKD